MMWGYGGGMGWGWVFGLLALVGIALLVVLLVRLFSGGIDRSGIDRRDTPGLQPPAAQPPLSQGRSRARQILDERFAQGELTAEQYREQVQVLGEDA
ncbi:SHOCT domain-containing protein [Cryobacterium mannosilyticum]|uniref:SHOCT domain-containing protein n=1 Tax=Cryobacterium mannosilyticum TaxID=1259190 RepID=A0A4R8WES7_9MICO|nr:SHOCT domain-containing protein [Cryobacterium mannosilyticum]TFC05254.1 SHOCT domain-containing protein [Cryobacterium mannosilyticum]